MTLTEVRNRARRLSRTDSSFATDAEVDAWINEGKNELSQKVGGFRKEEYLTLAARFDLETNFGFRITIVGGTNAQAAADVTLGTQRTDTTGTQVATDLQTAIRTLGGISTATVAYSTATNPYKFEIDSIDGTSVTIEAPADITSVDATDLLFGTSGTQTSSLWVSSFPEDSFVETDLGSGWEQIDRVEWEQYPLIRGQWDDAMSVEQQGDPAYFAVADLQRIRAWPSPTKQELFHVAGRGAPADITSAISFMPSQYHNMLSYYAASQLCEENFEYNRADYLYGIFHRMVKRYKSSRIRGDSRIGDEQIEYHGRRLEYPSSVNL